MYAATNGSNFSNNCQENNNLTYFKNLKQIIVPNLVKLLDKKISPPECNNKVEDAINFETQRICIESSSSQIMESESKAADSAEKN